MDDLIKVNYDGEQPTVSARELHEKLNIKTAFKDWFPRMCEYGFLEGKDFCSKMSESTGGRPATDYDLTIRCSKEICMIQKTEIGRTIRNYFFDLEEAWNTPEQVMARALKLADKEINKLKLTNTLLTKDVERMKPKEIFADAVSASKQCILVGELAKILKQNGIDTGEKRLYTYLREQGYLIKRKGIDYNMPTQKSMELGLFEIGKNIIMLPNGETRVNKTAKVTGRGQQYFIQKFLNENRKDSKNETATRNI